MAICYFDVGHRVKSGGYYWLWIYGANGFQILKSRTEKKRHENFFFNTDVQFFGRLEFLHRHTSATLVWTEGFHFRKSNANWYDLIDIAVAELKLFVKTKKPFCRAEKFYLYMPENKIRDMYQELKQHTL